MTLQTGVIAEMIGTSMPMNKPPKRAPIEGSI